jgi:hypothetical protein
VSGRKSEKHPHDVFMLCAQAGERLKAAGFEVVTVSMKTEAVYFRLPGRHGVLRVSAHQAKKGFIGLDYIAARLTFHGNRFDGHTTLHCSPEKIDTMIALAIGQYVLRSATPQPSRYQGKRGTWEKNAHPVEAP